MHDVINGGTTVAAQTSQQASTWTPALVVSVCALLFTVGSFWYVNAWPGRLRAFEPHSFAASVGGSTVLLLRFPLILHNTGAKPRVVQDLQLRFPDEPMALMPLPWRCSRSTLRPESSDPPKMPAVFSVAGRTAEQYFIEFGGPLPGFALAAHDYRIQIEARLGQRQQWKPLLNFTFRAARITSPTQFLAYSNAPIELNDEDKAKADLMFKQLAERLAEVTGISPPPMPPTTVRRSLWKRILRRT